MATDRRRAAAAALELLDADGLDKLTVRRVATALGVQAPALYWHFDDKRALLDEVTNLMLTPALTEDATTDPRQPWWEELEIWCESLRRGLLAHRDGARVALDADVTRARALGSFLERTTVILHRAGYNLGDASRAAGALLQFVIGRAVEEQSRPPSEVELELIRNDAFPFPVLAEALRERHEQGATPDEDFRYSLTIFLTGLRTIHDQTAPR